MIKNCSENLLAQSLSFAQKLNPGKDISLVRSIAKTILINPHDKPSETKPVFKVGFALNYTHYITIETDGIVFHPRPYQTRLNHNELLNSDIAMGRSQIYLYMIRKFPLRIIQEEEIIYQGHTVMNRSIFNSVTGESKPAVLYSVNYVYSQIPVMVEIVIGEGVWVEGFEDFEYLQENVISNIVAQAKAEGIKDLEIIGLSDRHWNVIADGQEQQYLVK